jgi:hypothetical protein
VVPQSFGSGTRVISKYKTRETENADENAKYDTKKKF